MEIKELLSSQLLQLPINWKHEGYKTYNQCVVDKITSYKNLLLDVENESSLGENPFFGELTIEKIRTYSWLFSRLILDMIKEHIHLGNPYNAFKIFHDTITDEKPEIKLYNFLSFQKIFKYQYRLREMEGDADFKDLFHVPFEYKHMLNSNRYSIPGYPTLYLSNSVYLAYKELTNPDYDNLFVSMFYHNDYYNSRNLLLDMTVSPQSNNEDTIFKFLIRWPLLMACSIKVGFHDAIFKQEYVVPQVLLTWVRNKIGFLNDKVKGVTYTSTKINTFNKNFKGHFLNTAIPVYNSLDNGVCHKLSKEFLLTRPKKFNVAIQEYEDNLKPELIESIELNGAKVEYSGTDFHKIESVLYEESKTEIYKLNGEKI